MKTIIIHILLLTGTATFDAWTTNHFFHSCAQAGWPCYELNPAVRPFVGKAAVYIPMPLVDLAIYGALRKLEHPKLAAAYAYGQSAIHLGAGIHNLRGVSRIQRWMAARQLLGSTYSAIPNIEEVHSVHTQSRPDLRSHWGAQDDEHRTGSALHPREVR